MNTVIIDGYVYDEPRIKMDEATNEATLVMFSLANREYSGKDADGKYVYETSYVPVKAFRFSAKRAMKLHKGDKIIVQGKLKQEKWVGKDGNNRSAMVCYMKDFEYEAKPDYNGNNSYD